MPRDPETLSLTRELAESVYIYRSLFDHHPDAVVSISLDRTIMGINQAVQKLTGYRQDELVGRTFDFFIHPDDEAKVSQAFQKAVEGEPQDEEISVLHKKGHYLTLRITKVPIKHNQQIIGVFAISKDITESKWIEQALIRSESRLSLILNSVSDLIFLMEVEPGPSFRCIEVNQTYLSLTGLKEQQLIGKRAEEILPEEAASFVVSKYLEVMEKKQPMTYEESVELPAGRIVVETTLIPIIDGNGMCTHLLGASHDITERKAAEEKQRLASKVIESIADGVMITDANNRILSVNSAFTALTGYSEAEVIGKKPNLLSSGCHDVEFYQAMWDSLTQKGQWEGEIWNRRKDGEIFLQWISINSIQDDKNNTINYTSIFRDITEKKRAEEKINYMAYYDSLTGLPNRSFIHDLLKREIDSARQSNKKLAVLFLDLDRFKNINDAHGHSKGDLILQEVAGRLRRSISPDNTIARWAGDEFVVLLPGMDRVEDASSVADGILAAFIHPFMVNGDEFFCSTSIGISIYPHDGNEAEELIKAADVAMYHAKELGNRYVYYMSFLNRRTSDLFILENKLRKALERKEFTLHYQPKVDLLTGRTIGAEALLRWITPDTGMIFPGQFINLAEEVGLIHSIDSWVLHTACVQSKAWQDEGYPPLKIAVNLSASHFQHGNIVESIENVLKETGLDAGWLELEITERTFMHSTESTIQKLKELKDMGVQIAIDDFGIGYSSLSYLKEFPFDTLKIDRTFIRDMKEDSNDLLIVKTVILLAQNMGMTVIAEGVETKEQANLLKELGCDQAQGYYYNKPLSIRKFQELLLSSIAGDGI